jgi:hydroxypyruvate isomerase
MLRLAANLSTLFTEMPLAGRFAAAAAAGFRAVEIQFPYALEPDAVRALLDRHRLELVLFNAPPGDVARGERGLAGLPGREPEFRASLERVREYAEATGCRRVHVMAGMRVAGVEEAAQFACFEANIAEGAARLASLGVELLLEPINTRVDVPGYLLGSTDRAVEILRRLARPNLGLQFDFYHQQIIAGDLARRFDALLPLIRHVQLADNPGRHEPGTGEINYAWLLRHVAGSPYAGWVGCEYGPSVPGAATLAWARPWL